MIIVLWLYCSGVLFYFLIKLLNRCCKLKRCEKILNWLQTTLFFGAFITYLEENSIEIMLAALISITTWKD